MQMKIRILLFFALAVCLLSFASSKINIEFDRPQSAATTRPGATFTLRASVIPADEQAIVARFVLNLEAPFIITKIFPEALSSKNCSEIEWIENRVQHVECHVMNIYRGQNVTFYFEVQNNFSSSSYGGRSGIGAWSNFLGFAQGSSGNVSSGTSDYSLQAQTASDPKISIYTSDLPPLLAGKEVFLNPGIRVDDEIGVSIQATMKVPDEVRILSMQSPLCTIQDEGRSASCSAPSVSSSSSLDLRAQIYILPTSSVGGKGVEIVATTGSSTTRSIFYLNVANQARTGYIPLGCSVDDWSISSVTDGLVSFNASLSGPYDTVPYAMPDNVLNIFVPKGLKVVSVSKVEGGNQSCVIVPSFANGTDVFCSIEQLHQKERHMYQVNTIVTDDVQYRIIKPLISCWGSKITIRGGSNYYDFGILVDNSKPTILEYSWFLQIFTMIYDAATSSFRIRTLITYQGPKPSTDVMYEVKIPLLNGQLRVMDVATSWGACQIQDSPLKTKQDQFAVVLCKLPNFPRINSAYVGVPKQQVDVLVQFIGPQKQAPITTTVVGTIIDQTQRRYGMANSFAAYSPSTGTNAINRDDAVEPEAIYKTNF